MDPNDEMDIIVGRQQLIKMINELSPKDKVLVCLVSSQGEHERIRSYTDNMDYRDRLWYITAMYEDIKETIFPRE